MMIGVRKYFYSLSLAAEESKRGWPIIELVSLGSDFVASNATSQSAFGRLGLAVGRCLVSVVVFVDVDQKQLTRVTYWFFLL